MTEVQTPLEDDDPHGPLIDEAGHLCRWLIGELHAQMARFAGTVAALPFLRGLLRHYLLPAEAALRRAIYLIANTLAPVPLPRPKPKSPAPPREGGGLTRQPRTPLFRLTEPAPRPRPDYLPISQRPRISVPGITPIAPAKTPAKSDPARFQARLLRRLVALEAAWNNPLGTARRLLRQRARSATNRLPLILRKVPAGRPKGEILHLLERLTETLLGIARDLGLDSS